MTVYRIDVPASGPAVAQPVEADSDDVVFMFADKEKKLIDLISKSGASVLFNLSDFSHLQNLVGSKSLASVQPNFSPGIHVLIFR